MPVKLVLFINYLNESEKHLKTLHMYSKIFPIVLFVFLFQSGFGQKSKLAAEYYRNGEFEKAAQLYKSLYKESKYSDIYFKYYFKSLLNDENYDEALKAVDIQIKKKPNQAYLLALKGNLYEQTGNSDKAEKYYEKAIKNSKSENFQLVKLANTFREFMKYDLALKTYKKGLKDPKRKSEFLYYIGNLYGVMGDNTNMIKYYIDYINSKPNIRSLVSIKSNLARNLGNDELDSLKTILIKSIQTNPDNINLIDLLSWTYLKMGNYKKAMRQIIAMDRRFDEDGQRVFKFAIDAKNAGKYSVAAKAFEYITDNKKQNSPYYFSSIQYYLGITKDMITSDTLSTKEDLLQIKKKYKQFINQYGINDRTFS
ncbi:MAG TPA: tetratricopeptide repeat protein, partial [Bacteroidetes bacterium]|nr:tetratricopeptide repeat protein [Bacteroidota bacterium]